MGPKKTQPQAQYNDVLQRLQEAEKKITSMTKTIEKLETRLAISENVSAKLRIEIYRVDQYQRRSNVVLKHVDLPDENDNEKDKAIVKNCFEKELKLPNVVSSIDKLHRIGKVKENNGKKTQDIIVRFKSHHSRYTVMNKRKDAKSVKIRPNLTKNRNNLLFEANDFVANINQIDFCFANIHGDLNVRMKEEVDGRQIFSFDSMEALRTLLTKKGCIEDAGEEEADVEE